LAKKRKQFFGRNKESAYTIIYNINNKNESVVEERENYRNKKRKKKEEVKKRFANECQKVSKFG